MILYYTGRCRKQGGLSILLAMDKIRKREIINKKRAELMVQAIQEIRHMSSGKRKQIVEEHQKEILQEAEIADILNARKQKVLEDKPFKLVVSLLYIEIKLIIFFSASQSLHFCGNLRKSRHLKKNL